jgi:adiponectin receptor
LLDFNSRLDYSGISLLIIGSFVPWLYYAFFCRALAMSIYIGMIVVLGVAAVIVSLWDKFAQPKFRPLRAGIFLAMGLSSEFFRITYYVIHSLVFLKRCCPGHPFGLH